MHSSHRDIQKGGVNIVLQCHPKTQNKYQELNHLSQIHTVQSAQIVKNKNIQIAIQQNNGSYLQIAKQNKRAQVQNMKVNNSSTGMQQQSVRSFNQSIVTDNSNVEIRQRSNPQKNNPPQFKQQTEGSHRVFPQRVRSLSPQNTIFQLKNVEQNSGYKISNASAYVSSNQMKIIMEQQIPSSPINQYRIPQNSLRKASIKQQNNENRLYQQNSKEQIKFINENTYFYNQSPLQQSFVQDSYINTSKNNLMKTIIQTYQPKEQKWDISNQHMNQYAKTPQKSDYNSKIIQTKLRSQELNINEKYRTKQQTFMKSHSLDTQVINNQEVDIDKIDKESVSQKQISESPITQIYQQTDNISKYRVEAKTFFKQEDKKENKQDKYNNDVQKKIQKILEQTEITEEKDKKDVIQQLYNGKNEQFYSFQKDEKYKQAIIERILQLQKIILYLLQDQNGKNLNTSIQKEDEEKIFKLLEKDNQQSSTINSEDKIQIQLLLKQLEEKDKQILNNQQRISQLESDNQFQQQELFHQIQKLESENKTLRDQMTPQLENITQKIPDNISEEINSLRDCIQHYEQEVQQVIIKEQSLQKLLESEKVEKQNLELLIDELRYQMNKLNVSSDLNSQRTNKDEIINCQIIEINSLKAENQKLKQDLQNQTQEAQQYRDCMLSSTVFYEKEIKLLKDQKSHFERQSKILDEKSKKKHSFIQAENNYILSQLTMMKADIEDKNQEIENLQNQLQQKQEPTSQNIILQFENEIQQLTLHYKSQLENEHNKFNETCSVYEHEISHYKQQIQSLIEKGTQNMMNSKRNQIHNQEQYVNNENFSTQVQLTKSKYFEEEHTLQKQKSYSNVNNLADISNTQIYA